jgi:GTP-binding protein EngB required for normal cell division
MKTVIDAFKAQQSKARAIQDKLLDFLAQGEAAGVSIDPVLKEKLRQSIAGNEKLKVALIGGFSEGKTSIAAAWLGKLKSDMNISHQESSNTVVLYEVDDDLILIDTPGLFGYKEKFNADTGEQEKYKDITRKYVSEAHLVLYVMNSTNPLKESHASELNWLFRELNLLPRTVFVLSRFDEVADVADEEDYQQNFAVKKQNVLSRLKDLISLKDDEAHALSIVAVSANPFDAGVEHWLSEPERFRQLSHIPLLQQATTKKIEANGGLEKMALETSKSIIQDVLSHEIPVAVEKDKILADELRKLTKAEQRASTVIADAQKKVSRAQVSLREFVQEHFTDLILQLNGTSMETISAFFEREIGDGGIVLDTKIQNVFSKNIDAVSSDLVRIQTSLNSDISAFDAHMEAMGRQGLNWIVKSNVINANNIKAARDLLWSSFKFKPWGAVKLAKGLNGALAFAGIAFEVWDSWKEADRVKEFENGKQSLIKNLKEQRRELLEKINDSDFSAQFFPGFVKLQHQLEKLSEELQKTEKQRNVFAQWRNNAVVIDAEFKVLKS